jgi:hypothetical protein
MTTMIFEGNFAQLDKSMGAKKIAFSDQCAAHLKIVTFLRNIKDAFLPATCTSTLWLWIQKSAIHSSAITECKRLSP